MIREHPLKQSYLGTLCSLVLPFQSESKCETILIILWFRAHFHMKGFALRLVLKQRHNRTRKWPMAFGKLLAFWFLFSRRRKSVFACWRSFYLFLNEKLFLFQYKCCIETRFSRCSSQQFAGFTVLLNCFVTILWTCWHIRELKQRRFWATDVNRKFMFLILARFHARPMSYKALNLACTTWLFEWKRCNTHQRGEASTSAWRPWLKNVCMNMLEHFRPL